MKNDTDVGAAYPAVSGQRRFGKPPFRKQGLNLDRVNVHYIASNRNIGHAPTITEILLNVNTVIEISFLLC